MYAINELTTEDILQIKNSCIENYGKTLHTQQREALRRLTDWHMTDIDVIACQKPKKQIVLCGGAGCGKSFLLQTFIRCVTEITKEVYYRTPSVCMSAPTHKAVAVLNDFAESACVGDAHITTIHSALHLIPGGYDKHGNQLLKVNKRSKQPHVSQFQISICDESSMIDPTLYAYAQDALKQHIWTGDDYQLPYVSKNSEDEDGKITARELKLSPVFTSGLEKINLTEVLRYDGAIAEYVDYVRQNIDTKFIKNPVSKGNLICFDHENWEEYFIERLKDDPLNVRAVAYTNNAVNQLAAKARETIYRDSEDYHVNEVLMAKEIVLTKGEDGKDKILMHSCQECHVRDIERITAAIPHAPSHVPAIEMHRLYLEDEHKEFVLHTPTTESLKKVVRPYMLSVKKAILEAPENKRASMWAEYYDTLNRINLSHKGNTLIPRLQFAGVLTINQAQGSGYPVIFHNMRSSYAAQIAPLINRLNYTGMTRAKKELYVNCAYPLPDAPEYAPEFVKVTQAQRYLPLISGIWS